MADHSIGVHCTEGEHRLRRRILQEFRYQLRFFGSLKRRAMDSQDIL